MKSILLRLLCPLLCAGMLVASLTGCSGCGRTTQQPSDPTQDLTQTLSPEETTAADPADREYDPTLFVVIRTAADLMAFGRAVNEGWSDFRDMTVVIVDDVDMSGQVWTPLDGNRLVGVTFEGFGHTISGLRLADHEYPVDEEPGNRHKGCGFVGVAAGNLTFRNLTFASTGVDAYDHSVGNFVGAIRDGLVEFENCHSLGFTANGWMDWFHRDPQSGGHSIAMRMGGFVGYISEGGRATFDRCSVKELTLSGFHNMAGFVGYDGSGQLDASDFSDCLVEEAEITFSYCLAEGYTADQPQKFVSVFYNSQSWTDTVAGCVQAGNRYADVTYYDWADDGTAYTPDNFISQAKEESHD